MLLFQKKRHNLLSFSSFLKYFKAFRVEDMFFISYWILPCYTLFFKTDFVLLRNKSSNMFINNSSNNFCKASSNMLSGKIPRYEQSVFKIV